MSPVRDLWAPTLALIGLVGRDRYGPQVYNKLGSPSRQGPVTNPDAGGWLEAVLVGARGAGWCMQPYCTTCSCFEFRLAYWTAAARQAGMGTGWESARHPRDFFKGLSGSEREVIVRTLVAGLRRLPSRWSDSEAFRTIIIDLDPPLILHGVPMVLDTELSGTPAGEELTRMRAHVKRVGAERERREAYESPEAVEERKRARREARASAHAIRQSQTRKRNAQRLELIAAFARLSEAERLARFAMDPALNLDWVSAELIPARESDLVDLETANAVALVARIGRRKAAWGRLRRMIEHRLEN
jgi:hypothetical protein